MIIVRVLLQTVVLALAQIWTNKMRAMLTALGIIIGVASVSAVIAALTGLREYVLSEFETFGAKKVFMDGTVPDGYETRVNWRDIQMQISEVDQLLEHCPSIARITPMRHGAYEVQFAETTKPGISVTGIWPEWHQIESRFVLMGRTFTRIDDEEARQVCLVNEKAIEELKLDRDPVGDYMFIASRRFLVVGVVETKDQGAMFGGGESQAEIYVPLSVANKLNPFGWVNYCIGELTSPDKAEDAKSEFRFVMRKIRNLPPEHPDTFEIAVLQNFIDQFKSMSAGITAVAGGVVAVSLLVGGIGIMNIMLVSVSERTREIGLRKAVGARPGIILLQFLVEAVVLCVVGGVIGLVLGQAMTLAIQNLPDANLEQAAIPPWAVALAFIFCAGTGVIFGMFPAIKAARLDPIEALRHE